MNNFFCENAWKMDTQSSQKFAIKCKVSYSEFKLYRLSLKLEALTALHILEKSNFDAYYQDYIVTIVGERAFILLKNFKMLEPCGIINDRKLYALNNQLFTR